MADVVMVECPACGATNRVPTDRLRAGLEPVCGKCREPLPVGKPLAVTDASFGQDVERSPLPVLVDAWAPWCGPCHMMAPEVEKLAQQTTGTALIVKVDTDAVPELGERFGIRSIPTVAVFKNGQVVARESGARPAADLQALLKRAA